MDLSQYSDEQLMQFAGMGGAKPAADLSQYSDEDLMKVAGVQANSRLSDDLQSRGDTIKQQVLLAASGQRGVLPAMAVAVGKGGAGAINDVLAEGVRSVVPESVKQGIAAGAQGAANLTDNLAPSIGDTLLAAKDKYGEFSKNNPEASDLIDAAANVVSLSPLVEGLKPGVRAVRKISDKLGEGSGVSTNAALAGVPDAVALRAKGARSMSVDDLAGQSERNWQTANDSFKNSHAQGAKLSPQAAQNVVDTVKQSIADAGILNPTRHADTLAAFNDLQADAARGELSLEKLDQHRQAFGDAIKDNTSKIDGTNSDGYRAIQAKNAIVDAISNLGHADFAVGNPNAANDLLTGINQYAKAARYDRVANLVKISEGDSKAIQSNFKRFVNNDNNLKGFNPEEVAALKDVAERGTLEKIERGLGTFGLDLGKVKNIALPTLVGAGGIAVPGGLPLAGVGTVLRQTGKYAARGKAQNALDAVLSRDVAPVKRPPQAPQPLALTYNPTTQYIANAKGIIRPPLQAAAGAKEITPPNLFENRNAQQFARNQAEDLKQPRIGYTPPRLEYSPETMQSETNRLLTSDAWNKLDSAQQQRIGEDIKRAWDEQRAPLNDIVDGAIRAAEDVNKATGHASTKAQAALKAAMRLPPAEARKLLSKSKP